MTSKIFKKGAGYKYFIIINDFQGFFNSFSLDIISNILKKLISLKTSNI